MKVEWVMFQVFPWEVKSSTSLGSVSEPIDKLAYYKTST